MFILETSEKLICVNLFELKEWKKKREDEENIIKLIAGSILFFININWKNKIQNSSF